MTQAAQPTPLALESLTTVTFADVVRGFHDDTMCDSETCAHLDRGVHPAKWLVFFSCDHMSHWCADRLERYMIKIKAGVYPNCSDHASRRSIWARQITPLKG